jgi:hypothetical protein
MFPVATPYDDALENYTECYTSRQYLLWIRDTFIRETPFRLKDLWEIVEECAARDGRHGQYLQHSLASACKHLQQQNALIILDDTERLATKYMWASWYLRYRRLQGS